MKNHTLREFITETIKDKVGVVNYGQGEIFIDHRDLPGTSEYIAEVVHELFSDCMFDHLNEMWDSLSAEDAQLLENFCLKVDADFKKRI